MTQNDRRGLGEDRLALAIASGKSVRDAAKEANISESTAYRRLSEATFRVRVDELRRKMTTDTIRLLSATGNEAVNCLRDAMQSADSTIRIRGGGAGCSSTFGDCTNTTQNVTQVPSRLTKQSHLSILCYKQLLTKSKMKAKSSVSANGWKY